MDYRRQTTAAAAFDTAAFDNTEAAPELAPVPIGDYEAAAVAAELFEAQTGTLGYRLMWELQDGEHAGRRVAQTFWLTEAALPFTKRHLGALGITSGAQLERTVPPKIAATVRVVHRVTDDGDTFCEVRRARDARLPAEPGDDDDGGGVNPFAPTEPPADEPAADESEHLPDDDEAEYAPPDDGIPF